MYCMRKKKKYQPTNLLSVLFEQVHPGSNVKDDGVDVAKTRTETYILLNVMQVSLGSVGNKKGSNVFYSKTV